MATDYPIDVAYCVEVNRVVDIQEACAEFFAQTSHSKFTFLCSDPHCRHSRQGGVRVVAANHNRLPSEQRRSPHFRVLDDHAESCYWKDLERLLGAADGQTDSADDKTSRKSAPAKVTRLITKFIIPPEGGVNGGQEIGRMLEQAKSEPNPNHKALIFREYRRSLGATATSLESLVTCFEELHQQRRQDYSFSVQNEGSFSFRQAFRHVAMGPSGKFTIHYGGASLQKKRYGKGFVLRFYDSLGEQPVSLYVSQSQLENYRPAYRMLAMIDELQARPRPGKYVRVYWIGGLDCSDKGWNAKFTTLAHVVLRLVEPTEESPTVHDR